MYKVCTLIRTKVFLRQNLVFYLGLCYVATFLSFFFFLNKRFYFEIIIDAHSVVTNNTERSCVPFTQFLPLVISSKTIISITDKISTLIHSEYRTFSSPQRSLGLPFHSHNPSYLLPNPQQPLSCYSFLPFCHFKNVISMGLPSMYLLGLTFFMQHNFLKIC